MPIIYSYPTVTPIATDTIIGTRAAVDEFGDNQTVTFTMEGVAEFVASEILTGQAGDIPIFGAGGVLVPTFEVPMSQTTNLMTIGSTSGQLTSFESRVELKATLLDSQGLPGLSGQILSSTGTGTEWAAGGDLHYVYTRALPNAIWYIVHNLGKYPSVTVVNNNNFVLHGEIEYIDINTLRITFSGGFSGKAYLN